MNSLLRVSTCCFRVGRPLLARNPPSILASVQSWRTAPLPVPQQRGIHLSALQCDKKEEDKENNSKSWPFPRVTMSDEQKKNKEKKIQEMKEEEAPSGMFAKVKYYLKRYWYIAVPAHMVCCTSYFVTFYALVHCGVDVISLLELLHVPQLLVDKIKDTPPSASVFVIAFLLYKIATPLRYATTLVLIQGTFWTLRRLGKLRTVREVEYKVRTEYEYNKKLHGRKLYRYRNLGVRDVTRKNSQGSTALRRAMEQKKKDD